MLNEGIVCSYEHWMVISASSCACVKGSSGKCCVLPHVGGGEGCVLPVLA